jgi:hypothetical protein
MQGQCTMRFIDLNKLNLGKLGYGSNVSYGMVVMVAWF